MSAQNSIVGMELSSSCAAYHVFHGPKRNLGGAVIAAAIEDYCDVDDRIHKDAAQFLYPQSLEYQRHYDWAVAMAPGINPLWLRDALERIRPRWDRRRVIRQRLGERSDRQNRPSPSALEMDRAYRESEECSVSSLSRIPDLSTCEP